MLQSIAIVTLVVGSLTAVEPAWESQLNYSPVDRGEVSRELSRTWDAPAMAGRRYVVLRPASGAEVYIRFIEAPPGGPDVRPFMTFGWNAAELLVMDPDDTARRLEGSPFRVIGAPKNLMPGENAPRAMQVLGPADEVLYMTRIIPGGSGFDLGSAVVPVDRVFITVVGGPSIEGLREFYGKTLGMPVGEASPWRIGVLAAAHGLAPETKFPLAVASLPKNFLVELDGYPAGAQPRQRAKGALPGGMAMVTFTTDAIAGINAKWRHQAGAIQGFPYNGRRAAVTVGPAGEWIEVIESAPAAAGP